MCRGYLLKDVICSDLRCSLVGWLFCSSLEMVVEMYLMDYSVLRLFSSGTVKYTCFSRELDAC